MEILQGFWVTARHPGIPLKHLPGDDTRFLSLPVMDESVAEPATHAPHVQHADKETIEPATGPFQTGRFLLVQAWGNEKLANPNRF